ncbi:MAG: type 1 glutamine amidotransferase [Actinomycetes bacterium]
MTSALRIALVYPDLLGTYGDRGNALVLAHRARARGIGADIVEVPAGSPLPDACDIYLLGGGEDAPQVAAAEGLRAGRAALVRALDAGAALLAVCAGFQLVGHHYAAAGGRTMEGLGLVDLHTVPGPDRIIGEVLVEPDPATGLPTITGFENHGGRTHLGPDARPLGRVLRGGGNGDGTDGVLAGGIVGTYLHGPVLPRNPALADHLLAHVTGAALGPIDEPIVDRYRAERLSFATLTGPARRRAERRLHRG